MSKLVAKTYRRKKRAARPAAPPKLAELPIGELTARMRQCWEGGEDFLSGTRELRTLPWILSFGHDDNGRKLLLDEAAATGAAAPQAARGEFTWHFANEAVWLDADFAMRREDGGRWPLFLDGLAGKGNRSRLAGVAVFLDADYLLTICATTLKKDAAIVRSRLDSLLRLTGMRLPVYIVVNRIDRLYGMRTRATGLVEGSLSEPLGEFRAEEAEVEEAPGAFATKALAAARRQLLSLDWNDSVQFTPAAFQAPDEISRLEAPLTAFCSVAFNPTRYHIAADLKGVFLGSSGPEGETVPPLPLDTPSFRPQPEEEAPAGTWFLSTLLESWLPRNASPSRLPGRGGVWSRAGGAAGLVMSLMLLCSLLTHTFLDARRNLRDLAGLAAKPASVEELGEYLDLATKLESANAGRLLPTFGMNEPGDLEKTMRARYCDSYRELRVLPYLNRSYGVAEAALRSGDAADIGNAVMTVSLLRRELSGDAATATHPDAAGNPLLADAEALRQLQAYRRWTSDPSELATIDETLAGLERRIVENACGGDVMQWLPAWIEKRPAKASPFVMAAWNARGEDETASCQAWTLDGYRTARTLLAAGGEDNEYLSRYRDEALKQWKERAGRLWQGRLSEIADGDLYLYVRQAANGEDPAMHMLEALCEELLPMFPESEKNPDIEWLRLYKRLLAGENGESAAREHAGRMTKALRDISALCASPETNLGLIRSQFRRGARMTFPLRGRDDNPLIKDVEGDPFADARDAARALENHLRLKTGSNAWGNLSPLSSYHYIRYLATRMAAVNLDDHWRNTVYDPSVLVAGRGEDKYANLAGPGGLLESFLTFTSGLWRQEDERIVNAAWDKLPFMFNRDFLEFCNRAVELSRTPRPRSVALSLRVDAVLVDARAKERPVSVDFVWRDRKGEQKFSYRNYAITGSLEWDMLPEWTAEIRVRFPSVTLVKSFAGSAEQAEFVSGLAGGEYILTADDFPDRRDAMARLGIGAIAIRSGVENGDQFFRYFNEPSLSMPYSVITGGKTASGAAPRPGPDTDRTAGERRGGLFGPHRVEYSVDGGGGR